MARFQQSKFTSLKLSRDDEKKFTGWVSETTPTFQDIVSNFLGEGFKISVSWVVDSNSFCFSVIGTEATKAHRNMVMTSWSDDLEEVAQIAAYKHWVVAGGGSWPDDGPNERWG